MGYDNDPPTCMPSWKFPDENMKSPNSGLIPYPLDFQFCLFYSYIISYIIIIM